MVYALIYTLFLGFGLQIGSDIYLLLDPTARHSLNEHAANFTTPDVAKFTGLFVSDNGTALFGAEQTQMLAGTFTFFDAVPIARPDVFKGCYRPPNAPWYLQPFPWWSQFIIVPIFSIFSSLSNLQPLWSWEMVVMVIISCCSYAANAIANHFIFNRSDVVSCIGAIAVGLLGNLYSRNMGGTAFTSMVTGVLFLVPVSIRCCLLPAVESQADSSSPVVRLVTSWRTDSTRKWSGHWCCDDCGCDWNNSGALLEPGDRICVWEEEKRCSVFILKISPLSLFIYMF